MQRLLERDALRLRGLAYVLVLGFLLLVTMLLSTALKLFTQLAGAWLSRASSAADCSRPAEAAGVRGQRMTQRRCSWSWTKATS